MFYEDEDEKGEADLLMIFQAMMRYSRIWDLARRSFRSCRRLGDCVVFFFEIGNDEETTHAMSEIIVARKKWKG